MPSERWDPHSKLGRRAVALLTDEKTLWLTTVDAEGRPQPNPVWFVWDGETVLVYSYRRARRNRNLAGNASVAIHFNTDRWGEEVIILSGRAEIAGKEPPVTECPAYLEKYGARIPSLGMDVATYAERYSVPIRIRPVRVRGF
jgi:PPOX class probable F420-dependent enzyme